MNKRKTYNSPRRRDDAAPAFCVVDTNDHKGQPETRCMVQAKQAEYFMSTSEMAMSVGPAPLFRDSQGYLQSDDMVPLHILNQARGIRPTYVVNGKTVNPPHYVYVNGKFFDLFVHWHKTAKRNEPTTFQGKERKEARKEAIQERKTGNMVSLGRAIRDQGMG